MFLGFTKHYDYAELLARRMVRQVIDEAYVIAHHVLESGNKSQFCRLKNKLRRHLFYISKTY